MEADVHLRSKCHEEEAKRIPNDHFLLSKQMYIENAGARSAERLR
jgi:hypothetical protein